MNHTDLQGYWKTLDGKYSLQFQFSEELDAGGTLSIMGNEINEELDFRFPIAHKKQKVWHFKSDQYSTEGGF